MASFNSVWSGVEAYDNQAWMTGRIQETKTTYELKTDAAAATLAERNQNIIGLRFEIVSDNAIAIEGTLTKPTLPFRVVLRTAIAEGNRIRVELKSISIGRIRFPNWLCRFAGQYIPPQKMGLPHWAGEAVAIQLNPAQQTAIISAHYKG